MSGAGKPYENSAQIIASLPFVGHKPTGLATYAINLTAELSLPGLTLLAPPALNHHIQPKQPCHEIPGGMSAEEGKAGHFRRLQWTQFQLPKLYRQLKSDLLFSLVPEAPIGADCRSIVMVHDLIPLRFPSWRSPLFHYARLYVPQVLKQAEHILCNSQATAQDICDFYGVPARKITPVLLSHDSRHFRIPDAFSESIAPPRPYFFYVGRHDPYKNLMRLIRAFAALPDDSAGGTAKLRQTHDLLIAGSPDPRYTPLLKQQAIELGVSEQVKFLDYVAYSQLPVLLSQAIALVYPSLWEGFGFPVLEAMACGAPVITSNVSSLPEVAGDAAILIDPYDEQALAHAMAQVAIDDQMRKDLRSAGLRRSSQFSWAKTGQQTAEVLQQFL